MSEKGQAVPSGFQAEVGAKVPQSLPLHQLPSNVAEIITHEGTTGRAK
jgi:hypothetical protein